MVREHVGEMYLSSIEIPEIETYARIIVTGMGDIGQRKQN